MNIAWKPGPRFSVLGSDDDFTRNVTANRSTDGGETDVAMSAIPRCPDMLK